ncbi:hypothetical protein [Micromonospora sp. NPDC048839]|uniref:hypothetical protein n=1 Tax=Micromonospora sp. NPDC048839 TaxID=3155641 RepID=UPI0033CDDD4A
MRKLTCLAAVALAAGAALLAATPSESSPPAPTGARPQEAQKAILAAFDRYDVVAGASPNDIFLDLIRNPAFPGKVDVIAVECGNSLYQPLLDRYIAGEDVPLATVRQVWRNTTQPTCGFSAFYERLFPLVREVNKSLPRAEKLRVLACDPPIDWNTVTSPEGLAPFEERDRTIAALMKKEVLAKDRKALMLFGISHLLHGGGSAVAMYEQEFPGVTYTIATHFGFQKDNEKLEQRLAGWPVPSVVPFAGTWLGQLDASYFESRPGQPPAAKGYPGADAYLYTGPRALILRQQIAASTVLDTAYLAELRRRAAATEDPPGGLMRPETFFQRELESGALEFGS